MAKNRDETRIYNKNKFKLGLFGMNCKGGLSLTKAPESWDASWDNNVKAAKLADEAGLEFLLPIGRWHGYQGSSDTQGTTFETMAWACGLLASTQEITTFGTLHVAFVNPVFAAKQMVTADHIGHGRFGLNVVSGWNPIEFGMMGVALGDHDGRYDYAEEWLEIVKRIWSEDEPFDFDGRHYKLKAVRGKPKPWWGTRPILVSAGNSETGRTFAANNADCLFTTVPPKLEDLQEKLKFFRDAAPPGQLRNIFASCHLMIRRTRKEAEDYHHYIVYEQGDWESAEYAFNLRGSRINSWLKEDEEEAQGPPDQRRRCSRSSAATTTRWKRCCASTARDSMALRMGMINYVNDFPHIRDELLPRMERAGLREPQHRAAATAAE